MKSRNGVLKKVVCFQNLTKNNQLDLQFFHSLMSHSANTLRVSQHILKDNNQLGFPSFNLKLANDTLNPLQLFIFTNVIRCSRLPL